MEIKAILNKPYTENERINFIVEQNHELGYEIKETETSIEAWGKTDEEIQARERERLDKLSMTRGDVFEALILAKGLGKAQIRAMIENAELDTVTKALYLNRFDEALEFYRGYPIFDMLGEALDITPRMLDRFFETKDYHYLTTCKLEINATPTESTVTGEGKYPYGTVVDVVVECEGYISYTETITLTENKVLNIELVKIVNKNSTDITY